MNASAQQMCYPEAMESATACRVITTTDLGSLTVLAQPMRLRIEAQLQHGPASSTTLARVLGESIELTNLHLEQMRKHGFIEEMAERSDGRERWWCSAHVEIRFPPRKEQTAEMRALIDEVNRINFAADLDDLMRSQLEQDERGTWEGGHVPYSRSVINVTPCELAEFLEEYNKLLSRFERPEGDVRAGARAVLTRLMTFPAPRPPVTEEHV
jgi:Helix-turn-helix domain